MNDGVDAGIHDRRWWILGVLCMNLVLVVAANNSLNVALPSLQRELHATESQLQWIVDGYGLVFAGLLLPAGALADRFGRRRSMQLGLVIFGSASLVAALAAAPWQLIVLRGAEGVGAAFVMPSTLSIVTDVFRGPERAKAIGIWSGFAGAGGALGLVGSGLLLDHFWWGSVFLVNVPIVVAALGAGLLVVPHSAGGHEAPLDPFGAALSILGFGGILFGIIEGPVRGWGDPAVVVALGLGVVVVAAFVAWQLRTPRPMLDVRLFRLRPFSVGTGTIVLSFFTIFGLAFVLIQYLQFGLRYSPLLAGLAVLPRSAGQMISSPNSARTTLRFGPRNVVSAGLALAAFGFLLLFWASTTGSYPLIAAGLVLLGLGAGQTNAPSTTMIMNSVRLAKAGVGSAVNDTTREMGGALGIAVLGSVFNAVYRSGIDHRLASAPASTRAAAGRSFAAALHRSGGPADRAAEVQHAAHAAISHAFGVAVLVGAGVLLVAAVAVRTFQHRGTDVGVAPVSATDDAAPVDSTPAR